MFGLRCHEGVSGTEGGTVFHPEYFLPLFSFDDNRNQGDASLMGGWVYLSAQKLLYENPFSQGVSPVKFSKRVSTVSLL